MRHRDRNQLAHDYMGSKWQRGKLQSTRTLTPRFLTCGLPDFIVVRWAKGCRNSFHTWSCLRAEQELTLLFLFLRAPLCRSPSADFLSGLSCQACHSCLTWTTSKCNRTTVIGSHSPKAPSGDGMWPGAPEVSQGKKTRTTCAGQQGHGTMNVGSTTNGVCCRCRLQKCSPSSVEIWVE